MADLEVAPPSLHSNAMETFQAQLTRKLSDALSSAGLPFAGEVTPATDPRFGDYQSNTAMVLAKQRGENPRKIAESTVSKLDVAEISEAPSVAGAGFINFTLKREAVEKKMAELRATYEPFVNALARRLLFSVPAWLPDKAVVDNWQTSAWTKRVEGIGALPLSAADHEHLD